MKNLLLILALVSGMLTFAQDKYYAGVYLPGFDIEQQSNLPRPYFYGRFYTSESKGISIHSIIGLGWNYQSEINATLGTDVVFGNRLIRPMIGLGVRFLGYTEMYKDFFPDFRVGLEVGKVKVFAAPNWSYREAWVQVPWQDDLILGKEPVAIPTIGLFYSF